MSNKKVENKDSGNVVLSIKEKCGYACTDFAGNLLQVTVGTYIMYFYTDVFGIPASGALGASVILLVARFADALGAILWGSIVDHTHTKWGQARPWFLWLTAPFVVTVWLTFFCPDIPDGLPKFLYALLTYVLSMGLIYTGVETALTAILPNLTSNPEERVKANSFRLSGGILGGFITCSFCIPLVNFFGVAFTGEKNDRVGFMVTLALFGIITAAVLLFAFTTLRERNYHPETQKPIPFKDSLRACKGNWPWIILFVAFTIFWIAQSTRNGTSTYYAKYVLGNENLTSLINGCQILGIASTFCMPFLVKHTNKTATMLIGLGVAAAGQLLIPFSANFIGTEIFGLPGELIAFTCFWAIGVLGASVALGMPFAMLADTVDYGEWKNGVHAAGFLTAVGSAFCIQAGSGFGAYVPLEIMNAAGYVANQIQTPDALNAISFCFIYLPVIVYAVVAVIMLFYRKYEKMEPMIKAELAKRHSK